MKYIFTFSHFLVYALSEIVTPLLSLSILELNTEFPFVNTAYNGKSVPELQYLPNTQFRDILGNTYRIQKDTLNMSGLCGQIQVYDSYVTNETLYGYIVKYSDCETLVCPGVVWQAGTSNLCIYLENSKEVKCKDFTEQNSIITLLDCTLEVHSFTNVSLNVSLKQNKNFKENPYIIAVGILLVCFCILILMKCYVYTFFMQEDRMVLA